MIYIPYTSVRFQHVDVSVVNFHTYTMVDFRPTSTVLSKSAQMCVKISEDIPKIT